ncbi:MAG: urea ABC transporter permease subunit UrtC [Dehalococcoidia bacterium]
MIAKALNGRPLVLELALVVLMAAALLAGPLFMSDFRLNLFGKFLTFAIVAIGIDVLWGYAGMLSLGQGVFFGLGGYAMAMYLKLEASGDDIPDFMTWSGLKELPWFWEVFREPWLAFTLALLGPALVAFALGYLLFRSQVTGVYFSIVTQALALVLVTFLVGQQAYSGGTNGITNYSTILGWRVTAPTTQHALYFVTVGALIASYIGSRALVRSRFGRLMLAVRDDEDRVRFSGYNVPAIKATVFAFSAALAGLAGALFVPQVGIISPANLGIVPSIEMVLWVSVGGRATLAGAAVGAVVVNVARTWLSESFPETWLYAIGAMFIGSVVLFPRGIAGLVLDGVRRLPAFARAPIEEAAAPEGAVTAGVQRAD